MKRLLALVLLVAFTMMGCASNAQAHAHRHHYHRPHRHYPTIFVPAPATPVAPATTPAAPTPTTPRCPVPAPTTVEGYAQLFDSVPTSQWGAADGAVSVPLPDGRSVWLYGDTFSTTGFVHSTAIVQDGGCLHVSHQGAQLIPNDDPSHVYWMIGATPGEGNSLLIQARTITLVGTGTWGFQDGGHTRTALATVDDNGDVSFVRWVDDVVAPAPDPGPMIDCEYPDAPTPHHFCYARHTHPEAHLADGQVLVTTCQNWDDGVLHPFADYRPIFSSQSA